MKNVTVTFTANQIETLLEIIRKDSAEMQAAGIEKRFIETNNRIEERIIKARFEANGEKGKKDKYTFEKFETFYFPLKNGQPIDNCHGISIYWNFFDRKNFYEVDGIKFEYLKDAKAYIKEHY